MTHVLFSKYSFERIGSETKTVDRVVEHFLNSQISQNIHDQGKGLTVKHVNTGQTVCRLLIIKYSGDSFLC